MGSPPAGTGERKRRRRRGSGGSREGSHMKQHKFWAFAAIACMVMCVITGKQRV